MHYFYFSLTMFKQTKKLWLYTDGLLDIVIKAEYAHILSKGGHLFTTMCYIKEDALTHSTLFTMKIIHSFKKQMDGTVQPAYNEHYSCANHCATDYTVMMMMMAFSLLAQI